MRKNAEAKKFWLSNRPFSYSENKSGSNDISLLHFVDRAETASNEVIEQSERRKCLEG